MKPKAREHDDYGRTTLIAALLPPVGILLGVVLLAKDRPADKALGEHAVAFSLLAAMLWVVVYVAASVML